MSCPGGGCALLPWFRYCNLSSFLDIGQGYETEAAVKCSGIVLFKARPLLGLTMRVTMCKH